MNTATLDGVQSNINTNPINALRQRIAATRAASPNANASTVAATPLTDQYTPPPTSQTSFRASASASPDSRQNTRIVQEASNIITDVFNNNTRNNSLPSLEEARVALQEASISQTEVIATLCCLLASGLTPGAAARIVGLPRRTVLSWQSIPAFKNAVQAAFDANSSSIVTHSLFSQQRRLTRLAHRSDLIDNAIDARAERASLDPNAPEEAHSGLFQEKIIINARTGDAISVWEFDAAITREARELEKQAAQESGQWNAEDTSQRNMKMYGSIDISVILGEKPVPLPPQPPSHQLQTA